MVRKHKLDSSDQTHRTDEVSNIVKWLYAIVMFGAAALIFILFEKIVPLNLYLVYGSLAIIVGLSVVMVLHIVMKKP